MRCAPGRRSSPARRSRSSTVFSGILGELPMPSERVCLAVVNADADELMLSSSGGAFSVLARRTISRGGAVYGHAFGKGLHVWVRPRDDLRGLASLRGSKYVQSDMADAMARVREDLKAGREVLFSGTPCQVDGLLAFLGGSQEGLVTVDIVCHGVPSQAFFHDCMECEFAGSQLDEVRFRDKREGWGCGGGTTTTTTTTTPVLNRLVTRDRPFSPMTSYYYTRFLAGDVYRESCYRCPYAGGERPGDFTIGDFWGIDAAAAGLEARRGISVVMANTSKAEGLLDYIKGGLCGRSAHWTRRCGATTSSCIPPPGRKRGISSSKDGLLRARACSRASSTGLMPLHHANGLPSVRLRIS